MGPIMINVAHYWALQFLTELNRTKREVRGGKPVNAERKWFLKLGYNCMREKHQHLIRRYAH